MRFLARLYARRIVNVNVNVVTAPLAIVGLWFYFFHRDGRRYRFLGWMFVMSFVSFAVVRSRSYYTAPLYPVLLAGGSVLLASWLAGARFVWWRVAYGLQWTAILAAGAFAAALALPIAAIGSPVWRVTSKVYDQFREEVGWPDLAHSVADVYRSLPADAGTHGNPYGELRGGRRHESLRAPARASPRHKPDEFLLVSRLRFPAADDHHRHRL